MSIGSKIKQLRVMNQLTQEELADRCDLTKGFISQLENDLNSPSISTLTDILTALGSNLKDFFAEDEDEKIVFTKNDYINTENDNHTITWLVPNALKNEMEPILVKINPNSELMVDMPHEGQEFGYILEGSIIVVLGNKQHKVNKGETFYFATDKPHYLKNTQSKVAKVLWISSPPNF